MYIDSLQQCITSSRGESHRKKKKKKYWDHIWAKTGQNQAWKQVFCYFCKFGSLVFLEIAYNDNLQQRLTFGRGKTFEKNLGDQILAKMGENQAQNFFLSIFSNLAH